MAKKTIAQQIEEAHQLLMSSNIYGCIAGSSMIEGEFNMWDEVPDVDVFVYSESWLTNAITWLMDRGWKLCTPGDIWKFERSLDHGVQKNAPVSTLKVTKDDIIINVSYKNNKRKLSDVLSSFDMSIIMIGVDIRTGVLLDWRRGEGVSVYPGMEMTLPSDNFIAVPNPFRKQDVDMYGVEMWVRQFNRVVKYWNRGYDTRPMARFYVKLITEVIDKGQLFTTEKSEEAFNGFKETFEPVKEQMILWLQEKGDE